jgi:hypothetical protein
MNNDASQYAYILIHAARFSFQPTMEVIIHNRCLDFKLTNTYWFSIGAAWNVCPNWNVDTGSMMSVDLIPFMAAFKGILTYELQRKYANPGDQSESTYVRPLVAWKFEGYKKYCVFTHLAEYDEQIEWDGIKLEEYCQRYFSQLSTYAAPIEDTWLLHDDTVLMTRLDLNFTQRNDILNITISEGTWHDRIKKPVWIYLKKFY